MFNSDCNSGVKLLSRLFSWLCVAATQPYSGKKTKKKLLAPDISLTLDRSEGSVLSDELDDSTELDLDDLDTPSDNSNEFEWEGKRGLAWCYVPTQSQRMLWMGYYKHKVFLKDLPLVLNRKLQLVRQLDFSLCSFRAHIRALFMHIWIPCVSPLQKFL